MSVNKSGDNLNELFLGQRGDNVLMMILKIMIIVYEGRNPVLKAMLKGIPYSSSQNAMMEVIGRCEY